MDPLGCQNVTSWTLTLAKKSFCLHDCSPSKINREIYLLFSYLCPYLLVVHFFSGNYLISPSGNLYSFYEKTRLLKSRL